jgi:hypothetical protein
VAFRSFLIVARFTCTGISPFVIRLGEATLFVPAAMIQLAQAVLLLSLTVFVSIKACQFVDGVDSHDEGYVIGRVSNQSVCCQACSTNVTCAMAVFDHSSQMCYAKHTVTDVIVKNTTTACLPGLEPSPRIQQLGVTHWGGCYNRSTDPFLLDGALAVQRLGFRTIKVS